MPSIRRTMRNALAEVIQSKTATTGERLEACKLLLKVPASATKGKPRGRAFAKKVNGEANDQRERITRLISESELITSRVTRPESQWDSSFDGAATTSFLTNYSRKRGLVARHHRYAGLTVVAARRAAAACP
jgi:hypothetical protein